jgi:diphthine-ammonia ligase
MNTWIGNDKDISEGNSMASIRNHDFFCSWSGGKDSCLALYHAIRNGGRPTYLLTMLGEDRQRSMSHGLPITIFQEQAKALGIPLITRATSWDRYEETFLSALKEITQNGIEFGVFGDIDLEEHLQWCQRVCLAEGVRPYHPLWKRDRRHLLDEFVGLGFKATIIAVRLGVLDEGFLGKILCQQVIQEIEGSGIDASGEAGEYHTVVTDGPIFSSPIQLEVRGPVQKNGCMLLDVSPVSRDP